MSRQVSLLAKSVTDVKKDLAHFSTRLPSHSVPMREWTKETLDWIERADIIGIIHDSDSFDIIPNLIRYIHFNTLHLENANLWVNTASQKYVRVFDGERFKSEVFDTFFPRIVEHYNEYVQTFLDNLPDNLITQNKMRVYRAKIGDIISVLDIPLKERKPHDKKELQNYLDNVRLAIFDGKECVELWHDKK
jgi:hypothetical protein